MKKLLLLATFAVSTAAMAQTTVLWDGESSEVGSDGGWWDRGKPTVVENPDKSGINTSDKCLKFTMTGNDFGQKHLALPFRDWMTGDNQLNLNGRRRVSMMIKKTNNENVEIELSDPTNGDPEQWKHTAAWYGSAGAWQKLVFDYSTNEGLTECPGVLAITASTGNVTANEDVYVDNIVVEDLPYVNGTPLTSASDLSGHLVLTGTWMKGECVNTDNSWAKVEYEDYALLESKLTSGVTSVDMREATLCDAYNSTRGANPNTLVYANELFVENGDNNANFNVIVNGETQQLELKEDYAFSAPENFNAANVTVFCQVNEGANAFCLPFWTNADEIDENAEMAKFREQDEENVVFKKRDGVDANVPFLVTGVSAAKDALTFSNKGIVATPETLGEEFVGFYGGKSDGEDFWSVTADNTFEKTGADVKSFRAYLVSTGDAPKTIVIDEQTAINNVSIASNLDSNVAYDLQGRKLSRLSSLKKGVYVVNGKKVLVK